MGLRSAVPRRRPLFMGDSLTTLHIPNQVCDFGTHLPYESRGLWATSLPLCTFRIKYVILVRICLTKGAIHGGEIFTTAHIQNQVCYFGKLLSYDSRDLWETY